MRAKAASFLDFCFTPELAAEATLQPIRRFGLDAAILFADILVVPHALGPEVEFREGEGPVLEPIRDAAGARPARRWALRRAAGAGLRDGCGGCAAALPADVALIGFAGAPWTVATYMVEGGASRDFAAAKRMGLARPGGFRPLIDLLIEATIDYLSAQIEAGAEAVQLFDSWAGGAAGSGLPALGHRADCGGSSRALAGAASATCRSSAFRAAPG